MGSATLRRGVKLQRGAYLEIEVDGVLWKITRQETGLVTFEVCTSIGYITIDSPPEAVTQLWKLVNEPAQGSRPH